MQERRPSCRLILLSRIILAVQQNDGPTLKVQRDLSPIL